MSQPSRISAEVPQAVIQDCLVKIQQVQEALQPYLISLPKDDRNNLPKMSDKTVAFVTKVSGYTDTNPDFAPNFLDIPEMKRDLTLVSVLKPLLDKATQLMMSLEDTSMLSGSEAYVAALMYYNNVKSAAQHGLGASRPIYEDLSVRFPGRPKGGGPGAGDKK